MNFKHICYFCIRKKIQDMFIEKDKKKHFLFCAVIAVIAAITARLLGAIVIDAACYGFFISCGVGVLKEAIWDELMKKGTEDEIDWVADVFGATAGSFVSSILLWLINIVFT